MEKMYSKAEIVTRAKDLAKMISQTEEIEFFKKAEKQINENLRVQELIAEIKKMQKEAVNLQHYQKHEALKSVEQKIDELNHEIEEIPLVREFQQSQRDVNDILQLVSTTISNTVTDEVIDSMGGDKLKGTTTKSPFTSGCE